MRVALELADLKRTSQSEKLRDHIGQDVAHVEDPWSRRYLSFRHAATVPIGSSRIFIPPSTELPTKLPTSLDRFPSEVAWLGGAALGSFPIPGHAVDERGELPSVVIECRQAVVRAGRCRPRVLDRQDAVRRLWQDGVVPDSPDDARRHIPRQGRDKCVLVGGSDGSAERQDPGGPASGQRDCCLIGRPGTKVRLTARQVGHP
jgi:hypothetical protein